MNLCGSTASPRVHIRWPRRIAPLTFLLLTTLCCSAQDEPTYTLHVHTDLLQIPVLIRSPKLDSVPKVNPARLAISIDGGIPFPPERVRREGNDPITLGILLDADSGSNDLLRNFAKSIVKAAGRSLHADDQVAIYVLNCTLSRASTFTSPDAAALKLAATQAVEATRQPQACTQPLRLRDSLSLLTAEFAKQTGRRILLILSEGADPSSNIDTAPARKLPSIAGGSVAIFGLSPSRQTQQDTYSPSMGMGIGRNRTPAPVNITLESQSPVNHNFDLLCRENGGVALSIPADNLTNALVNFVDMVRERFIIEFPRPKETTVGGVHVLAVTLARSNAYINAAGVGLPLPDPQAPDDITDDQSDIPPPSPPDPPVQ